MEMAGEAFAEFVDSAPAKAFELFRTWKSAVSAIAGLFLKLQSTVEKVFIQLSTGEALLSLQGGIADMLIDLQATAGLITEAEAKEIKITRAEDTDRAKQNNEAIAEGLRKQQQIDADLTSALDVLSQNLASEIAAIDAMEDEFEENKNKEKAAIEMPDFNEILAGFQAAKQETANIAKTAKQGVQDAMQQGSVAAAKQAEENRKKQTEPVVAAVDEVKGAVESVESTIKEVMQFVGIG